MPEQDSEVGSQFLPYLIAAPSPHDLSPNGNASLFSLLSSSMFAGKMSGEFSLRVQATLRCAAESPLRPESRRRPRPLSLRWLALRSSYRRSPLTAALRSMTCRTASDCLWAHEMIIVSTFGQSILFQFVCSSASNEVKITQVL